MIGSVPPGGVMIPLSPRMTSRSAPPDRIVSPVPAHPLPPCPQRGSAAIPARCRRSRRLGRPRRGRRRHRCCLRGDRRRRRRGSCRRRCRRRPDRRRLRRRWCPRRRGSLRRRTGRRRRHARRGAADGAVVADDHVEPVIAVQRAPASGVAAEELPPTMRSASSPPLTSSLLALPYNSSSSGPPRPCPRRCRRTRGRRR